MIVDVDYDGAVFPSSPQAGVLADNTSASRPGSQSLKSKIGSVNHHPTMNGTFGHSTIINNLINASSAIPCDTHGNFLNDDEPPPPPAARDPTDWSPFTSREQFETAEFLFKRAKMSAGNIDELLKIWAAGAAASGGEPPFINHADVYDTIDVIPVGGVPWQNFTVSYNGPQPETDVPPWMEETFEIYFRDPRQLFLNILANPAFAEDFDYTPMQIFDINGSRRYEHFMSGDWAWKQAVCLLLLRLSNSFANYTIHLGHYLRLGSRGEWGNVCSLYDGQ